MTNELRGKKKCPLCGSLQLVQFRIDSDWAEGAGDWTRVNEESDYEEWQNKQIDDNERQDVTTFYCYACGECFNKPVEAL